MRRLRRAAPAAALAALLALGWWAAGLAPFSAQTTAQCVTLDGGLQWCALSEMAKLNLEQTPVDEHPDFAIARGPLQLHAARNEVVGFQWLLRGAGREGLEVSLSPFARDGEPAEVHASQYLAHYHYVDRGGYQWGPPTRVLPWPAHYPDALVPQWHRCSGQQLYRGLPVHAAARPHTLLWQDLYIDRAVAAGDYRATATLSRAGQTLAEVPLRLTVWPATLPDENSLDAVGELYRSYRLEGVGEAPLTPEWRRVSNCYQQLAHAHRSVFLERSPFTPRSEAEWRRYREHVHGMLSGSLFSAAAGYHGPGAGTPVSLWRTPWPQPYDMRLAGPLRYDELRDYETRARTWSAIVEEQDWHATRWFAYVFDEVDGPEHGDRAYLAMARRQMALVQQAIDAGSGAQRIDLLWTSHSDPSAWRDDPELDLRGKLRLLAPNAHAADPTFLEEHRREGGRAWFYHSGHPAVGAHSINAHGTELRSWGAIAARYQLDGVLMWAVNLGADERPFADPNYKPEEDRFGNGVLVYPGQQLPKIGFAAARGGIPSLRLKAWRRGLQDYELAQLAAARHPEATAAALRALVPAALADGEGEPAWPGDPAAWIAFKRRLLALASTS